jgi:hypothetical protein
MTDLTVERAAVQPQYTRQQFIADWKALASNKSASVYATASYIIARSVMTKEPTSLADTVQRLREAFTPVTNEVKLANGRSEYDTLTQTINYLRYYTSHNLTIPDEFKEAYLERVRDLQYNV